MVRGYFKITKITHQVSREENSKENSNQLSKTGGNKPFKDLLIKMQFSRVLKVFKSLNKGSSL